MRDQKACGSIMHRLSVKDKVRAGGEEGAGICYRGNEREKDIVNLEWKIFPKLKGIDRRAGAEG